MHGLVHPEMGHVRIPHDRAADPYEGHCPFHGDCLEGLACGPAMNARWGRPAEDLPDDHPAWALEARYLALALNDFVCTLSPRRIILGGGVMERLSLFPKIHRELQSLLNGYVQAPRSRPTSSATWCRPPSDRGPASSARWPSRPSSTPEVSCRKAETVTAREKREWARAGDGWPWPSP